MQQLSNESAMVETHDKLLNISSCWDINRNPINLIRELVSQLNHKNYELTYYGGGSISFDQIKSISIDLNINLSLHNYTLNEGLPFVLNLASHNIRHQSINLIKQNIVYSRLLGSNIYSFHAGFLVDPSPSELGKGFSVSKLDDRSLEIFLQSCGELSNFASATGIRLLVENNVLTKGNFNCFNQVNPLLCVDPQGTHEIMTELAKFNVAMLLDFGHLKVSSNTLNFTIDDFMKLNEEFVGGYHYSDNNGIIDNNSSIHSNSFFWSYLNTDVFYHTLEVSSKSSYASLRDQIDLINHKIL